MDRVTTNADKLSDLEYITSEDLLVIELNAALLDLEELFEMLFIDPDELSENELKYCKLFFRKGRKGAIANATKHLFRRMEERNGTSACIEFLQNCGKFTIEGTSDPLKPGKSSGSGGFAFNVYMPGDKKPEAEAS